MSTATAPKKDKKLLYVAIYFAFVALGWIIPPVGALTPEGMKLLGVFVAAVYGWSVTSHVWPSFITFVLLLYTGLIDLPGLIVAGWGNDTFFFMTLIFVVVAYLETSGVTTYICALLMTRKFLMGHPWRLLFMLFLVAWLLCSLVNIFAGVFITWGIIYKICNILDYKPYDKFSNLLIFGAGVMGALSLSAVPWHGNALVILASFANSSGTTVNMLHYLVYSVPFGLLSIVGFLVLCKFVFRLDVSKLKSLNMDIFPAEDLQLTSSRKIALSGIGFLILIILLPSIMPPDFILTIILNKMGLTGKLMLVYFILSLLKADGKPAFDFAALGTKGVPWNMVIMSMCILTFVDLLGNPASGISATLAAILTPVFADISVVWFFLITLGVTIVLTNFMINMVVAVIMMTATLPVAVSLGIPEIQIVYLLTISCTIAFMLPAASAASCILFANTQWMRAKDIYKYAVPTILMLAAIALLLNLLLFAF